MLPLLQAITQEDHVSDVVERLAQSFRLSQAERHQLLPSGPQTAFANRVDWARTYLQKAGLIIQRLGEALFASLKRAGVCSPCNRLASITIH